MDVIESENLKILTGVQHGFWGRTGGVSTGLYESLNVGVASADTLVATDENRRRVAAHLGLPAPAVLLCNQVHGNHVITVTAPWALAARPDADAMVTREKGIGLSILTADCVPVLFADATVQVIGAAHAGWRGAVGGVIENTLTAMEKLGAQRGSIHAAVGPCIGPASYEVGPDFPVPFIQESPDNEGFFQPSPKPGHFLFDLAGYVAQKLGRLGVASVAGSPADTCAAPQRFFSYRYACLTAKGETGRQASVIVLKD